MKNSSSIVGTAFRALKHVALNRIIAGLLLLAILVCVFVTGDVFTYILCLVMLAIAISFGLLVLVMNLIWRLLPGRFEKTYGGKRGRLNVIVFLSLLLFLFVAVVVDVLFLRGASGFISLLGNAGTFAFAVFWGWSLIKRNKVRTIVGGSAVFILFIAILSFASSNPLKTGEITVVGSVKRIKSLPYVAWVPAKGTIEKAGVVRYDPELAFDGLNLYNSQTSPEAYLIDMHGNVVHKWTKNIEGGNDWDYVEICEDGDLLVNAKDQMLIRLDWDSNVKWKRRLRFHHDMSFDEDRKIYAIAREDKLVFWRRVPVPILSDYITVLSAAGEMEHEVYLYDLVKDRVPLHRIVDVYRGILNPRTLLKILHTKIMTNYTLRNGESCFDIMHTNSIEIMDRDIEGFCTKGDWLISIRELDFIGVLDPARGEFIWRWGPGELRRQHHPTLLENGNVLIFDNGRGRGFSRIIELDPLNRKIVWEYTSEPREKFYSKLGGCCYRLPNGNTLITESDKGYVFEITEAGEVVWEFYNPNVKPEEKKRGMVYRMMRITDPEINELLNKRI
ncbi:MAG: hypothetical protein JSV99_00965 [Planctomycetota bacterium]|nr:MAG: hypothetical protein JSV99_00965 [Planctomycetota bacterium]